MYKNIALVLNNLYDRYQIALFIVENGFGIVDRIKDNGVINKKHFQLRFNMLD